jgi:hypothetical protein
MVFAIEFLVPVRLAASPCALARDPAVSMRSDDGKEAFVGACSSRYGETPVIAWRYR